MDKPEQQRGEKKRKQKWNPSSRIETLDCQRQERSSQDVEEGCHQEEPKDKFLRDPCTNGDNKRIIMGLYGPDTKWNPGTETVLEKKMVVSETNNSARNQPK